MGKLPFLALFHSLILFVAFFCQFSIEVETIAPNNSIGKGETLVSSGKSFEFGYFSPANSKKNYLAIWYKNTPEIVVWIANKENPVTDPKGVLFTISTNGTLLLLNQTNGVIWSSSSSKVAESPVIRLLDSGNLVLQETVTKSSGSHLWESFDYPSKTWLPGMKIGGGLKNRYLVSWKNLDDPSSGEYNFGFEERQLVIKSDSIKKYRSGQWNGIQFNGLPFFTRSFYSPRLEFLADGLIYSYEPKSNTLFTSRIELDHSGFLHLYVLKDGTAEWSMMYTIPDDQCDSYGKCGANAVCRVYKSPICECLNGFIPKSQYEWETLNWSSGCVRRTSLNCQNGDGFMKLMDVKLPDLADFHFKASMSIKECQAECFKKCDCMACANSNVSGEGSSNAGTGCLLWYGDLIDIKGFTEESRRQDVYIRLAASELEAIYNSDKKRKLAIILSLSIAFGMLTLGLVFYCIVPKKRRIMIGLESKRYDTEVPFFEYETIIAATDNFSDANKIGAGGFGSVYKGNLPTGEGIAVKRLSKNSGQGLSEFKNEVVLIAKLQHRNLVRLFGYCVHGEERILIYEYMPNKSLDYFIFDNTRCKLLSWQKRFDIVLGIARGLLYLHQDSRLQIIHRDLKASNILLDSNFNPKVSDFGLARTFGGDEDEAKTNRVVGTYGYMSPEYAVDGIFSSKSDVFSLGVILLEIVSGKKNRKFYHPDHRHNLLGHAWLLWNENRAMEIMGECEMASFNKSQVLRCVHVGLLCVQNYPEDRPAMSSVVFMLANDQAILPHPKHPGFFTESSPPNADETSGNEKFVSQNAVTITIMQAR